MCHDAHDPSSQYLLYVISQRQKRAKYLHLIWLLLSSACTTSRLFALVLYLSCFLFFFFCFSILLPTSEQAEGVRKAEMEHNLVSWLRVTKRIFQAHNMLSDATFCGEVDVTSWALVYFWEVVIVSLFVWFFFFSLFPPLLELSSS